jgi:thiamine transport system substrate-binding protein
MVLIYRLALAVLFGLAVHAASAQDKPTLTIYTYDAFAAEWGPAPGLKAGFEDQCDCIVEFVAADSSIGALRRVQLEGDTTEADIVLGLDTSMIAEARETGLFAAHSVDLDPTALETDWRDPLFVPFDYGFFAFIYNSELLPDPPTSFEKLAGRPESFKIAIQDPRSSTTGLGLVLWLQAAYPNDTDEAWAEIAPHVLTVTRSWSESYNLFLSGEVDMVLSYTTSPAYHTIAEGDARYKAAKFSEGHYVQIEIAGILASSDQKELANAFLAWLVTPDAQEIIPTTNWMYPVTDIGDALPPGFDELIDPEPVLLLDDAEIAAHRDEWIKEALGALE